MLNPFPDLLVYSMMAPFIVRLAVGLIFIRFGALGISADRHRLAQVFERFGARPGMFFAVFVSLIELIAGAMLVVGFYTQIAAVATALISIGLIWEKLLGRKFGSEGVLFDLLLLSVSLSLLFSGAGFLAFDLPL